MLFNDTVLGHVDKVQKAIDRLKTMEPRDGSGYYLAFSGGKDSQCVYHLAKMAGVKFDAHYSVTSVDPPELMRFIKKEYPDVIWDYPVGKDGKPTSMWKEIAQHTIPPTRQSRYCCDILKEQHGEGRVTITGVRWAESIRRRDTHGVVDVRTASKKIIEDQLENNPAAQLNNHGNLVFMDDNEETRRMVEHCFRKKRTTVNPIIDWGDDDVWEFLNEVAKVPHCCLYDEGFTRLGCIGCPLQGREGMIRDFERWPRYKELYTRAFEKMIANHPGEIRVASGAPVPEEGGAQQYTQDGSLGIPDGNNPIQETVNSGNAIEREREREREVVDVDSRGELQLLDQQELKRWHRGWESMDLQTAWTWFLWH